LHFIVRFEPRAGEDAAFREELLSIVEPTRAEPGCLSLEIFEGLAQPPQFGIHSEWVDQAAFESHARQPHTMRLIEASKKLLTHDVAGLLSRKIA
jgi:quinol monooxygenase YgiN